MASNSNIVGAGSDDEEIPVPMSVDLGSSGDNSENILASITSNSNIVTSGSNDDNSEALPASMDIDVDLESSSNNSCGIAPRLENSRLSSIQCNGNLKPLSKQDDVAIILKRCGMFDHEFVTELMICEDHHHFLGKHFAAKYTSKKYCFWRDHVDASLVPSGRKRKRPNPNAEYRIIDETKIQSLLEHHEFLIPTGGGVCAPCRLTITNLIKQIPVVLEDPVVHDEVHPSTSQGNSQNVFTQSSTSNSTDSQRTNTNDSPEFIPEEELVKEKMKALNRLFELTKQDVRILNQLTKDINDASPTTISAIMDLFHGTMLSFLDVAVRNPTDRANVMTTCMESSRVEKFKASYTRIRISEI